MRSFPGFEHLYQFFDPFSKSDMRADIEFDGNPLELTRGVARANVPLRATWEMGGARPSDVIWTTAHDPLLVNERIVKVLRDGEFTGWSTYPVTVMDKNGVAYNDYQGLIITGRCGERELSRSAIELKELPGGWFPYFAGFFFDERSWDGSDLFMEVGTSTTTKFMTQPVADALRRAHVKNLGLTRLTEVRVPTSNYEIGAGAVHLPPNFRDRVHAEYDVVGVRRPRKWQK
jgi:hypothetical protein